MRKTRLRTPLMLAEFEPAGFAADGFGELRDKFDFSRVFVRRNEALTVGLQGDFQVFTAAHFVAENNKGFNDLAAERVGRADDRHVQHGWVLQ